MPGAFEGVVPIPTAALRARLFDGASDDGEASDVYARLLRDVDALRSDYGEAIEETRHPDILRDKPWPEAASVAWQAAAALRVR
jgi:hypothetical protein